MKQIHLAVYELNFLSKRFLRWVEEESSTAAQLVILEKNALHLVGCITLYQRNSALADDEAISFCFRASPCSDYLQAGNATLDPSQGKEVLKWSWQVAPLDAYGKSGS